VARYDISGGLVMRYDETAGRIDLTGARVDPRLAARLRDWLYSLGS